MKLRCFAGIALIMIGTYGWPAFAQGQHIPVISTSEVVLPNGTHAQAALDGRDPVYRYPLGVDVPTLGAYMLGTILVRERKSGTLFAFANVGNAHEFQRHPWRYIPKLGGYCAGAMEQGNVVHGHPDDARTAFVFGLGRVLFGSDRGPKIYAKVLREDRDLSWIYNAGINYERLAGQKVPELAALR